MSSALEINKKISQDGSTVYAASSAGSDDYAITLVPAIAAYTTGQIVQFEADVANTGASTLNINGIGAIAIKKNHDQDLADNDIEAGQIVTVVYDGTNFQMQSQLANATSLSAASQAEQEAATATNVYVSPGRQQFHPSAIKSQCLVTISGGSPTLQTNYNVSSITDNGVGLFTINFSTSFSSENYAISGITQRNPGDANNGGFISLNRNISRTASSCSIAIVSNAASAEDFPVFTVMFAGDQS